MNSVTITIASFTAVATGITVEATGEIGKDLLSAAKQWLDKIGQHSPDTAPAIAAIFS